MAVIELSVPAWQCLDRRIESAEAIVGEVEAWEMDRNERMVEVKDLRDSRRLRASGR